MPTKLRMLETGSPISEKLDSVKLATNKFKGKTIFQIVSDLSISYVCSLNYN